MYSVCSEHGEGFLCGVQLELEIFAPFHHSLEAVVDLPLHIVDVMFGVPYCYVMCVHPDTGFWYDGFCDIRGV